MCNTVHFTTCNPVHTEKLKPIIDPMYNTFPYLLSYFTMSDKVMEITVLWNVTLCSLPVYYLLLCNPKLYHHSYKSQLPLPILIAISLVQYSIPFLELILILSCHILLVLPSCLFPSYFPTKTH